MGRKRMRGRLGIVCLLLAGMLCAGCGQDGSGTGPVQPPQSQAQNQGQEKGALDVQERYISMDRYSLYAKGDAAAEGVGQLLKMKCLATGHGTFIAGTRKRQESTEMAIYWAGQGEEPKLAASFPRERVLVWCETSEGIAYLGTHAVGSGENGEEVRMEYVLRTLAVREGKLLEETGVWTLTDFIVGKGENRFMYGAMALEAGRLILAGAKEVMVVALPEGTEGQPITAAEYTIPTESAAMALRYEDADTVLALTEVGKLHAISLATGRSEIRAERLCSQLQSWFTCVAIGTERVYAAISSGKLYAVDIKDGQVTKLADFAGHVYEGSLWVEEDGSTLVKGNLSLGVGDRDLYQYSFSPAEPAAGGQEEREVITLEAFFVSDELKRAARKFNQSNDRYQVEIVDMDTAEVDMGDYRTRLYARLLAGDGPDLMMPRFASGSLRQSYIKQGLLEDLTPYIQRDLDPAEYVRSVLYAYAAGDYVYALCHDFTLEVLVTEKKWVDSAGNLSLREVMRMADASGVPTFRESWPNDEADAKSSLLGECLQWAGDDIFDMEVVRECILFAEKYWSDHTKYTAEGAVGQDTVVIMNAIGTPLDLPDIEWCYGKYGSLEEPVIMGIPRADGARPVLYAREPLCITSTSKHKEGAWAFIRYLMGEEYQFYTIAENYFPVRKDAFDALLERYLLPNWQDIYNDEDGEVLSGYSQYTLRRCLQLSAESGVEYELWSVDEAYIKQIRDLVDQAVVRDIGHPDVVQIVDEEAGVYYGGGKTLDAVMEIIENRIATYRAVND